MNPESRLESKPCTSDPVEDRRSSLRQNGSVVASRNMRFTSSQSGTFHTNGNSVDEDNTNTMNKEHFEEEKASSHPPEPNGDSDEEVLSGPSTKEVPQANDKEEDAGPWILQSQTNAAGQPRSDEKSRKKFRKSLRNMRDFLRMGHGREESAREGAGADTEEVWRSKMGWGPRLPGVVEYESQLLEIERACSYSSAVTPGQEVQLGVALHDPIIAFSKIEIEIEDERTFLKSRYHFRRQCILLNLHHPGLQVIEFLLTVFLLTGTALYMLVGAPGIGGILYEGACVLVMIAMAAKILLTCYAKPKYPIGTACLLDLVTLAAIVWEIVWFHSMNVNDAKLAEGFEESIYANCGDYMNFDHDIKTDEFETSLPWSWNGYFCYDYWSKLTETDITQSWNQERILKNYVLPLRYLTAIRLLKLAYLNTFNNWFGSCARRNARVVAITSDVSSDHPNRPSSVERSRSLPYQAESNDYVDNMPRYSANTHNVSNLSELLQSGDSSRPARGQQDEQLKDLNPKRMANDKSLNGFNTSSGNKTSNPEDAQHKLFRRSDTIGNKLTQVFMSKAALGYMVMILITSYLYRPSCLPNMAVIDELSNIQSLLDRVLPNGTETNCSTVSSCCGGQLACMGALTQFVHEFQETLLLLLLPKQGVAYNSSRDQDSSIAPSELYFNNNSIEVSDDTMDVYCHLRTYSCEHNSTMCEDGGSELMSINSVTCDKFHVHDFWVIVLPSTTQTGFYTAVVSQRAVNRIENLYSLYLSIFVASIFLFGTALTNCSVQSFAYKLSNPLKRLAVEMQRVANLDFTGRYRATEMRPSNFVEIFKIQAQFLRMRGTLKSFAKFVPESVVKLHFEVLKAEERSEHNVPGSPLLSTQLSLECPTTHVELRLVTLLFSDIKSFTTLCESIPPKEMCLLLNEYFEAMCMIVDNLGGTTIEFIGDAMLVAWNIPCAVENHTELCLRFAIAAQNKLKELRSIWFKRGLPRFEVRMGVHTGLVYAGILGSAARFKYGMLGDSLNVASYLEEANKRYESRVTVSSAAMMSLRNSQMNRESASPGLALRNSHLNVGAPESKTNTPTVNAKNKRVPCDLSQVKVDTFTDTSVAIVKNQNRTDKQMQPQKYPIHVTTQFAVFRCIDFVARMVSADSVDPIYQAMDYTEDNASAAVIHHKAVCFYLNRQFKEAIKMLDKEEKYLKNDHSISILRERCLVFQENPPPQNWRGESISSTRLEATAHSELIDNLI